MLLAIAALLWTTGSLAQTVLPPSLFQNHVKLKVKKLESEWKLTDLEYGFGYKLCLNDAECPSTTLFLDQMYQTYSREPERLDDLIDDLVGAVRINLVERGAPLDLSQIVPLLRRRDYDRTFEIGSIDPDIASKDFFADLIIILVENSDLYLRSVSVKELEAAGYDMESGLELAKENLQRLMGPVHREDLTDTVPQFEAVKKITAESGLVGGYFFLDESCQPNGPSKVAIMYSRSEILEAELEGPGAFPLMLHQQDVVRAGEEYSRILMICKEGNWQFASFNSTDAVANNQLSE